jgi:tripartite-type tricarboxylate transporter receptor subunit TctC
MTISRIRRTIVLASASMVSLVGVAIPFSAFAQTYPTHEIRLIVPLTPGSSVDVIARSFIAEMGRELKQPVVVENRPGAEGVVATELTKNAQPDGYTLMLVNPGHAINVHLYPKLPFDTLKDFTPVALAASNVNVLVVPAQSPIKDLKDLIARAKAKPGDLNFASVSGTSGGSADLLNLMAGLNTTAIVYKGAAEAQTDLLGGRLDYMFTAISTAIPLVRSGKLRALAVTGAQRHPTLPDVPAMSESVPGFEVTGWYGIVGPAGMPPAIVATLNKALFAALQSPEVKARLGAIGIDPAAPNGPEDFDRFVRAEIAKWGKVVKPRS